jgi:redox-sensitive bicupin YhaK (pirin superfamily)
MILFLILGHSYCPNQLDDASTKLMLTKGDSSMITLRKADERGAADYGWLDARHSFSFGNYFDPANMEFRSLRVMNEDRVAPGKGFDTHPHKDMEIITYVIEGALAHKDSMGNGSVIHAGEFQKMSAGSGILHSEFNPSEDEPVHLYQIWIQPSEKGVDPSYAERLASELLEENAWDLIVSPDEADGVIGIVQDARLYLGNVSAGRSLVYSVDSDRHVWTQVVSGSVEVNGMRLSAGDGAAIVDESDVEVVASMDSEIFLFDLA